MGDIIVDIDAAARESVGVELVDTGDEERCGEFGSLLICSSKADGRGASGQAGTVLNKSRCTGVRGLTVALISGTLLLSSVCLMFVGFSGFGPADGKSPYLGRRGRRAAQWAKRKTYQERWAKIQCQVKHEPLWTVNATSGRAGPLDLFSIVVGENDTVTLQTRYGGIVAMHGNGDIYVETDSIRSQCSSFRLIQVSDGIVAFRSSHGAFLRANPGGSIRADGNAIGPWESFFLARHPDGKASLKNLALGRFLKLTWPTRMKMYITGSADRLGDSEGFHMVSIRHNAVALRTFYNTYVTVARSGALIANPDRKDMIGVLAVFRIVPLSDAQIALKTAFGKYVSARKDGTLDASAEKASAWEAFTVLNGIDGAVSLQTFHGTYLSAKVLFAGDADAAELRVAGAPAQELTALGYTAQELHMAGYEDEDTNRYKFSATTPAPREKSPNKVACMAGQPFMFANALPSNISIRPGDVHIPRLSKWSRLWKTGVAAGNSSFCETPVRSVMHLASVKHGFGSSMNNFVNEVFVSMYTGLPLTLCIPPNVQNLWMENYLDPGLSRCAAADCAPPPIQDPDAPPTVVPELWIHGAATSEINAAQDPIALEGVKRFIYQRLFVMRPHVEKAVRDMESRLGLASEPYVGVHIRRGDKKREAGFFRSTLAFVNTAQDIAIATGSRKIFLASDDPGAYEEFQSLLAPSLQVVEQPRLPPGEYTNRGELNAKTEMVLVVDLGLLVRAAGYVGTASSNLDRFVWFQRDPAKQSVSLDDGNNFLYRSC